MRELIRQWRVRPCEGPVRTMCERRLIIIKRWGTYRGGDSKSLGELVELGLGGRCLASADCAWKGTVNGMIESDRLLEWLTVGDMLLGCADLLCDSGI